MSIGFRLREERLRLGFSQPAFAALAGVTKGALVKWEKDTASPNALALTAFAEAGADAYYILSGKREPTRPDIEHQDVDQKIAKIKNDLIDPKKDWSIDETKEQTDKRVVAKAREALSGIIKFAEHDDLPSYVVEEAKSLFNILNEPNGLELFRAADYAQGRERRSEEWDLFAIWLKGWPYQPDEPVMRLMIMMAIDYGVPHRMLVELSQEIAKDVREQEWADGVIQHHDTTPEDAGKKTGK